MPNRYAKYRKLYSKISISDEVRYKLDTLIKELEKESGGRHVSYNAAIEHLLKGDEE